MSAEQAPVFSRPTLVKPAIQMVIAGMEDAVETQLEAKLARFLMLKEAVKEYHQLRQELKPLFEGERQARIGMFTVSSSTLDVPEKAVRAHSVTRLSITH